METYTYKDLCEAQDALDIITVDDKPTEAILKALSAIIEYIKYTPEGKMAKKEIEIDKERESNQR